MAPDLPRKDELQSRAREGDPITSAEVSTITSAERDLTGRGPVKGGSAATAQRLRHLQENFYAVADNVASKPSEEVTQQDATYVQRAEARASAGPPGKDSTSAKVQAIANQNAKKKKAGNESEKQEESNDRGL